LYRAEIEREKEEKTGESHKRIKYKGRLGIKPVQDNVGSGRESNLGEGNY
jgi:hypothetical protein